MVRFRLSASVLVLLAVAGDTWAAEPNETFATATVLAPGVLSVVDELLPFPDTMLATRDQFGMIDEIDDDGSTRGDLFASGMQGVLTNSGSIDFAVTGYDDFGFIGAHTQRGRYEVFIDAYDLFGDLVDSFSEVRVLESGIVHEYSFYDFEWIGGSYDVNIDNTIGPSDLDFFTFTGLAPGAAFTVRTLDPDGAGLDTYLGWFDHTGTLQAAHDDIDVENGNVLSLLEGQVPANGNLTFAVTGFGDEDFLGSHSEVGGYELLLEVADSGLPGDHNGDGSVDAADYVVWRRTLGSSESYDAWQTHFGQTAGGGSAGTEFDQQVRAVPEPIGLALGCIAALLIGCMSRGLTVG